MRHKQSIRILVLMMLSFQLKAQDPIKELADKVAGEYLHENRQVGSLVIGLFDNGRERIFYYGETEKDNNRKPVSNNLYELGNLSETFTCILFADRTIKGRMYIDDKLQKYLPVDVPSPVYHPVVCRPVEKIDDTGIGMGEPGIQANFTPFACYPDTNFQPQPILLCYLGTHTSGLPDLPDNLRSKNKANPFSEYSTEDMYDFLRRFKPDHQVGFDYKHSSLGMALLGKTISIAMNLPYEQVLKECILDSLGMDDTGVYLSTEQYQRLVTGYNTKGNKVDYWSADVFAPAIGLHSTPFDMMRFLRNNISGQKNYFTDLLDFTHNSRLSAGDFLTSNREIGLGWKITTSLEDVPGNLVFNSGHTGGFACYVGFVEVSHTGVFVLSSVSKSVDGLAEQLIVSMQKNKLK